MEADGTNHRPFRKISIPNERWLTGPGLDPAARRMHHGIMRAIGWWGGLSRRRRMLFAGLAVAVMAGAIAGVVGTLSGAPGVISANANRPGDVLLVPGYGGSTTALDGLAARISAAGRTAIVVRLAGDGTGDLRAQANVLNGYVDQVLSAGSGPVTVIGYSAGGVVAWLWDEEYHGVTDTSRNTMNPPATQTDSAYQL